MDLSGKVALITGAAGGMGSACAQRLAAAGATVVGTDVTDEAGQAVFDALGAPHRYVHLDVTDPEAWARVVADVVAELGGLDIVHLNAGISTRPRGAPVGDDPIPWSTPEAYRRVMAVNADGPFYGLMAVLPHVTERKGDVVVTASTAGLSTVPPDPIYSISKHAATALVANFAPVLLERGVRLNAICPGIIDTGLVPPDLRAVVEGSMSPPSFIADVLMDILERGESGQMNVASSNRPGGLWVHEFDTLRTEPVLD
jgi:NAD(P)-dependent dehydrogenase (short-subunit alcohol dehydrogenase family)